MINKVRDYGVNYDLLVSLLLLHGLVGIQEGQKGVYGAMRGTRDVNKNNNKD